MLSIGADPCFLIEQGKKRIEARKTYPTLKPPFRCFIYECKGDYIKLSNVCHGRVRRGLGKVIGEFVCDEIVCVLSHPTQFAKRPLFHTKAMEDACLTRDELEAYAAGKDVFGWHISDLKIYEEPRELSSFSKYGYGQFVPIKRPPQSWMYVEVEDAG